MVVAPREQIVPVLAEDSAFRRHSLMKDMATVRAKLSRPCRGSSFAAQAVDAAVR
jgi:hypothetical protein